ncbi:MAG TPA: 3'(2'),5'-bisphosphate nucleotidase [Verrucomicrobia bacterium]|nr:3'(2'),5'-bisphosphate nucleotidase [Verrucomicrobiota bacterium]
MADPELQVAVDAVVRAARLCEAVRAVQGDTGAMTKEDRSPVTVADFGSQALVIDALRRAFHPVRIVAEEDAETLLADRPLAERVWTFVRAEEPRLSIDDMLSAIGAGDDVGGDSGRFWTLDPIDGTKGFIRGDHYAVALARLDDGSVTLGILGCPSLVLPACAVAAPGFVFYGARDEGAWCRPLSKDAPPQAVHVSQRSSVREAVFCESVENGHTAQGSAARICAFLGVAAAPLRMDSQCKYAAVASGMADVYLRLPTQAGYEEKIWDHAAGALLVEQAGGRVTDVFGAGLDFTRGRTLRMNKGVLATNGLLHSSVLGAIAAVIGEQ